MPAYNPAGKGTFMGIKSGNFVTGSSGGDCDPFEHKETYEHASAPYSHVHGLALCTGCEHRLPFFMLSDPLYKAFSEVPTATADIWAGSVAPKTLMPAVVATGYTVGADTVAGNLVNVDSVVDVTIERDALPGVVIDVSEFHIFADSVYANAKSAARDEALPGSSVLAVTPTPLLSTVIAGAPAAPSGTLEMGTFAKSMNLRDLVHRPRVAVRNCSGCSVYLVDHAAEKAFEGIHSQMGVRSGESVSVVYDPVAKRWSVADSNARA